MKANVASTMLMLVAGCGPAAGRGPDGGAGGQAGAAGVLCIPGASVACACTDSRQGAQACNASGSGFEPCICAGASGSGGAAGCVRTTGAGGSIGTAGADGTGLDPTCWVLLGWIAARPAILSPSGSVVALFRPDGSPDLRHWPDDAAVPLSGGAERACAVAFSPDGSFFTASTANTLTVWRVSDGSVVRQIPEFAHAALIRLSTAGDVIAAVIRTAPEVSESAPIWRLADPGNVRAPAVNHPPHLAHGFGIRDIALSPDGAQIALLYDGRDTLSQSWGYTDAWTTADMAPTWSISHGVGTGFAPDSRLLFSPDGTIVAAVQPGPKLGILDPTNGSQIRAFDGALDPWMFSADGTTIAAFDDNAITSPPTLNVAGAVLLRASDGSVTRPTPPPEAMRFAGVGVGPSPANAARVVYRSASGYIYTENGATVGAHPNCDEAW
jgi:WD40 repeat protein